MRLYWHVHVGVSMTCIESAFVYVSTRERVCVCACVYNVSMTCMYAPISYLFLSPQACGVLHYTPRSTVLRIPEALNERRLRRGIVPLALVFVKVPMLALALSGTVPHDLAHGAKLETLAQGFRCPAALAQPGRKGLAIAQLDLILQPQPRLMPGLHCP